MKITGNTQLMTSQASFNSMSECAILNKDCISKQWNANKMCAINCILKAHWETVISLLRNPVRNTLIEKEVEGKGDPLTMELKLVI